MKKDKKKGQILVEAVMVLPIILVILFSTLDFAKIFVRQMEINFLAYNAGRIMMVHSPDVGIVDKHINDYSSLYKYLDKNNLTKKMEHDDETGAYYLVLDYKMHKTVKIVPWDFDLVRRAVAPFQLGDPNPRHIPYKWKGTTTSHGEPAIKGFDYEFRSGMAKIEGIVPSTSGGGLSSFLMKQWYPEKANVGGVSFLVAAKFNSIWSIIWWYGFLDSDTRKAIDAYMMFGLTPAGFGQDQWLSRKYTGFMHGKDRITYWGMGYSPPPPIAWSGGPSCETGWSGQYMGHSWTRQPTDAWARDDGAFYWAQSHEVCTDPIETPWGCVWCAKSEFTPVTHMMITHAGGGIWSNKRSYWNFYNAVWALANIPESYATATYRADYWNIEDDWYHFGWEDRVPGYAPDQVSGMTFSPIGFGSQSGMSNYPKLIPKGDPADEQNTLWAQPAERR